MEIITQIRKRGTNSVVEEFDYKITDEDAWSAFSNRMGRNFGMDMSWKQFNEMFKIVRFETVTEAPHE